nr:hypothetical protein [Avibacterium avium]
MADLPEITPNSVSLFYRKIKDMISYHLAQNADEVFSGEVELDEG